MLKFLRDARKLMSSTECICIVIGNESCDLDSVVSALSLAFLYKQNTAPTRPQHFLPILNIPRRDYPLKTEVKQLLCKYNISEECLTFRDELNEEILGRSVFILVDHHVSPFAQQCIEVFDHRKYDGIAANLPANCKTTIELVGSCSTLVAELYLESDAQVQKNLDLYSPALTLLHNTIVLDTVNFSPAAARFTEKDEFICERLEKVLGPQNVKDAQEERQRIFQFLCKARADTSTLTAAELLRKDMKIICNGDESMKIAIPGFPILVQDFITRPKANDAVQELARVIENCSVVLLMGMLVNENDSSVQRDIGLVNIKEQELFVAINKRLLSSVEPALSLEQHKECYFMNGIFYKMRNIKATRKHILPIVKSLLDKWN